jgi:dienelactone hydrolase
VHRQGLHFRPGWEKVVTPVDFAVSRSGVDPHKIVLYGVSFGEYLAPRAAAFEQRVAACIADDGIYDYGACNLPASRNWPVHRYSRRSPRRAHRNWTRVLSR